MVRRHRVLFAAFLLAGVSVAPAEAAPPASPWAETEQTAVRLIAATEAVGTTETVPLGLEFRLEKDWKIYWRSPGDAGFPPRPDWSGSENLAEATLRWPVPTRFSVLGLETLGYEDAVVLPLAARLERPGKPLRLRASIDYLTCKEICIPYTAELALDLPGGEARPSPFAHLINRFAVRVPGNGAAHGLSIQRVEALGAGNAAALRVVASAVSPFGAPDIFVEGPPELVFDRPDVLLEQAGHVAVATLGVHGLDRLKQPLTELQLTVTLADGPRGAERTVVPVAAANGGATVSLAMILGLALLGGLILNLMPCVLPVLSIKLLGVVSHGGRAPGEVRLSFLATAAGIVFSFLVLAAGLIGVKAAGGVIGWGIQFQQPWFLVAMAVIVTLFAGNLWGFFEIRLPAALSSLGGSSSTARGLGGSFLTGAFATLLATPCSAPFLGTAVAFALARGADDILLVFTALGLGLALPYLLVAVVPALATHLPKPGPWMIGLRRVLGFALAATAAWLVTVLAGVLGIVPAAAIAFVLAVILGFLAAGHHFGGPFRAAAMVGVAALTAIAFVVPISAGGPSAARPTALSKVWQPFDEAAIGGLVEKGNVVFVDVTADWCVTCQINKTYVLGREAILARLSTPPVLAMEADWTRPNTDIARYLASFGRYGIPFNVVYGPRAPQGLVLPELLSEAAVLDALKQAAALPAN